MGGLLVSVHVTLTIFDGAIAAFTSASKYAGCPTPTAFSPLAGGWLTGKYKQETAYPAGSRMTLRPEPYRHLENASVFAGLAALGEEARARGVEMSALAVTPDAELPIARAGLGAAAERYARLTLRKSEQTQATYLSTYRRFAEWLSRQPVHW